MEWKHDEINFVCVCVCGNLTAGVRNNRRALSTINQNIRAASPHPYAVHKRGILTTYVFFKKLFLISSLICLSQLLIHSPLLILFRKNAACNKDPVIPVHRPVTRFVYSLFLISSNFLQKFLFFLILDKGIKVDVWCTNLWGDLIPMYVSYSWCPFQEACCTIG